MPRASKGPWKEERSDGSIVWKACCDTGPDPATGKRRQRRATFATQREAKSWLAQTRAAVDAKTYVAPKKITLGEFLDSWLEGRVDVKPTTKRNYQDALRPVRTRLAARPLQALTLEDVQGVVGAMLDGSARSIGTKGKPLSARAVRLMLTILGQALEDALNRGYVQRNVARQAKRPKQATAKKSSWEPEQVAAFLAAADEDPLGGAFRLSLHGLRLGEVCGLKWEDVDLDSGDVRVCRSRVLVAGLGVVEQDDAKTAASVRTVWMGPGTTAAVRRLQATQREAKMENRLTWAGTGLVVVDDIGRGLRPDHYAALFAHCVKAAGLPTTTLHEARHSLVSYLLSQGVPVAIVQRMVGHADATVTLSTYTHPVESGAREQVMDALVAVGL